MLTDRKTFSEKIRGFFSLASENLSKKDQGNNNYVFSRKDYSFPVDDQIQVKSGLGQFGTPAYIPWVGFMGPGQKPQKGIYPVILNYLKQRKVLIVYGVSAVSQPDLDWGSVKNKDNNVPMKIRDYFKDSKLENHDYDDCFIYSVYTSELDDDELSNIYDDLLIVIDLYKNVLYSSNPSQIQIMAPNAHIPFSVNHIIEIIRKTGLIYSDKLIKRFAFSLMSKRFLILSGLAGSGKTQLALAFASALVKNKDEQMCVVSVGADWTNREPLLGFPNALQQGKYVKPESGVLDLLIEANRPENAEKPFFLILDEMNMSYVERYFADFLSAMESKEPISLWSIDEDNGDNDEVDGVPQKVALPNNLFIIGTINVDETTYMFSPKVLDRANVIEFKISPSEMADFLKDMKEIDRESINGKAAGMGADFVNKACKKDLAQDKDDVATLQNFFNELKGVNAEFGYRSATEIFRFICQAKGNDDATPKLTDAEILDAAIVQKLLPKLHGSRKKLEPVLVQLWKLCFIGAGKDLNISKENVEKAEFKESADKIRRMYESATANGFTSFAEA